MEEQISMLKQAGFVAIEPVIHLNSFVSYVARKKAKCILEILKIAQQRKKSFE